MKRPKFSPGETVRCANCRKPFGLSRVFIRMHPNRKHCCGAACERELRIIAEAARVSA